VRATRRRFRRARSAPHEAGSLDGNPKAVSPATVNRELATLSRALRIAVKEKVIPRASLPAIEKLDGERNREFVLDYSDEVKYLELARNPSLMRPS